MKKIFTFVAALFCAVCLNAQTRTNLWEGSFTFDASWPSVVISSFSFASAKIGDKIVVTVDKADTSINPAWEWGPQVFINVDWTCLSDDERGDFADGDTNVKYTCELTDAYLETIKGGSELEIHPLNVVISKVEFVSVGETKTQLAGTVTLLQGNKADLNEYGCANVANGSTSYRITFTEEDVTGLKEYGLYAFGYGLNVTQVNLIQPNSTAVNHILAPEKADNTAEYNIFGIKNGIGICVKSGKNISSHMRINRLLFTLCFIACFMQVEAQDAVLESIPINGERESILIVLLLNGLILMSNSR